MDELSSLAKRYEFREKWRGYDPREVDEYVELVRETAKAANAKINELEYRVHQVGEGQAQTAKEMDVAAQPMVEPSAEPSVEPSARLAQPDERSRAEVSEELVYRVEVAQTTIDGLLADARQRAEQIVTEAQSRLTEATTEAATARETAKREARDILAKAMKLVQQREAAAAVAERERHSEEIASLERRRTKLEKEVELLEEHLAKQRDAIASSVAKLHDLVGSPDVIGSDLGEEEFESSEAEPVELETAVADEPSDGNVGGVEPSEVAPASSGVREAHAEEVSSGEAKAPDVSAMAGEARGEQPRFVTVADINQSTAQSISHSTSQSDDAMSEFFNQDEDQRRSNWFLRRR